MLADVLDRNHRLSGTFENGVSEANHRPFPRPIRLGGAESRTRCGRLLYRARKLAFRTRRHRERRPAASGSGADSRLAPLAAVHGNGARGRSGRPRRRTPSRGRAGGGRTAPQGRPLPSAERGPAGDLSRRRVGRRLRRLLRAAGGHHCLRADGLYRRQQFASGLRRPGVAADMARRRPMRRDGDESESMQPPGLGRAQLPPLRGRRCELRRHHHRGLHADREAPAQHRRGRQHGRVIHRPARGAHRPGT